MASTNSKSVPWIMLSIGSVMMVLGTVTSSHIIQGIAIVFFVISIVLFGVQIQKENRTREEKKESEALEIKKELEGIKKELERLKVSKE